MLAHLSVLIQEFLVQKTQAILGVLDCVLLVNVSPRAAVTL